MTKDPHPAPATGRPIFFDTEFIENGTTIDLLSIGLVDAWGATYYAEIAETNHARACPWVKEHVLPHLTGPSKSRVVVRQEIQTFCGHAPIFWADHAAYDWVALCQLFGRMVDLPKSWPMFCRDVAQLREGVLPFVLPQQGPKHHALADAVHCRRIYEHIRGPA